MTDRVVPTYDQWIAHAAQRYDVPKYIIAATIMAESSGNPAAVSPSGAIGLMQVMPNNIHAWIRNNPTVTMERFKVEPRLQILCGTWVLNIKRWNVAQSAKNHNYDQNRALDWVCIMAAYFGGFVYETGKINWNFKDGAGTPARVALERYTRYWLMYREYFNE